ncbi:hypothetical protein chiPu_0000052 [Chiloscyllium punctatum]|uniref:SH3 domain-containing protein n=1 Tax=Chiloscyllium punctatum TaxID=137246 RepID=A0A401RN14_CHIPU|nr:hypothetical protein [Chiloscyllium punctatum]
METQVLRGCKSTVSAGVIESNVAKGKIADRVGYFPATFVQKVLVGEKVFRCTKPFSGCKEEGQINVKENQICVDKGEETNGFIKVCSGKKKGFVPLDILVNI